MTDLALGGGATLDIGVYPISCMLLAFGSDAPSSLAVAGTLTASGADKSVSVSAVYGEKQVGSLSWTIEAQTPEEWKIIGTKGVSAKNAAPMDGLTKFYLRKNLLRAFPVGDAIHHCRWRPTLRPPR